MISWTNKANDPLWPGQAIKWNGLSWRVGAVLTTGGERYYQLVRQGEVAMMPASEIETRVNP